MWNGPFSLSLAIQVTGGLRIQAGTSTFLSTVSLLGNGEIILQNSDTMVLAKSEVIDQGKLISGAGTLQVSSPMRWIQVISKLQI